MARATRARALLRRCLAVIVATCLLLLVMAPVLAPGGTPVAEAVTRTGNLWVVSPGAAAEIQPAINAARDIGGGRVRLPAGVYLLTAKISVHSNVILYGDGIDRTILRWAPGRAADTMMSNGSSGNGNTNLQIWDLTLDGEGRGGPSGESNCCFGLRLNNVRNSFVVNVAADRHSKDGIYLGYNNNNGAVNVRVSGCRANNNGRNGIALIHGDGNAIDHCQVNGNSTSEWVAGIDLEPDEGLSLTNNKVVSNSVVGNHNNGIQFFVPYNGFATSYHNSACYNYVAGNRTGIEFRRGDQNIFVDNQTENNGLPHVLDDSTLIGSGYAGWCTLGALPPHPSTIANPTSTPTATLTPTPTFTPTPTLTPTPTPTPKPRPSCAPRPAVTVNTQRGAPGSLVVTVTVTRPASAPLNEVYQLQFGPAQNASIEIGGQTRPGGSFSQAFPVGTQTVSFTVRRLADGQPTTVPFSVVDDCGTWQTFVGGGPAGF